MKRQWIISLAMSLGVLGSTAFGQYTGRTDLGTWQSDAPTANVYSQNSLAPGVAYNSLQPEYGLYPGQGYYAVPPSGTPTPGGFTGPSQYGTPSGSTMSSDLAPRPHAVSPGYPSNWSGGGADQLPTATSSILEGVPQVPRGYLLSGPQPAPPSFGTLPYYAPQYDVQQFQNPGTIQAGIQGNAPYQLVTTQNGAQASGNQPESIPSPGEAYGNSIPSPNQINSAPPLGSSGTPATAAMQGGNSLPTGPAQPVRPYMAHPNYAASLAPNCVACGPAPVSHGHAARALHNLCGLPACARPWYFGAGFIFFDRIDCDNTPLSYYDGHYGGNTLSTADARMEDAGGLELNVGRYFNGGRNAIEFNYWGIYPESITVENWNTVPGEYRTYLPFEHLMMPGTPSDPATPYSVYDWYDNAYTHTLTRVSDYYSFAVNLLGFGAGCAARNFNQPAHCLFGGRCSGGCGATGCSGCRPTRFCTSPCCLVPPTCGSCLNLTWLAGFRYFVFKDNIFYGASLDGSYFERSYDDLFYEVCTTNQLAGFQTGGRLDFCLHRRVNLYGSTNVGIYNNHSTLYTLVGTDYQHAYLDDTSAPSNPDNGGAYYFKEARDRVAFLSELGTGVGIRLGCCCSVNLGYRAIIASGVATAPGNVRTTFNNFQDVRDFDSCGTLVLHGFSVGGTYNF